MNNIERFRCYTAPDGTTDMVPDQQGSWCYYKDYEKAAKARDEWSVEHVKLMADYTNVAESLEAAREKIRKLQRS